MHQSHVEVSAELEAEAQPLDHVLHRLARREQSALTELVTAYDADMVRLSYMICADRDIARDATQQAWYRVWSKPPSLRDESRLRSWLLSVAANEARQIMRRRGIGRVREIQASTGLAAFDSGRSEERLDLRSVMGRLAPDERELIGLRYGLEMSSAEIGAHLGITSEGVRTRLHRLLARMRKDLESG